LPFFLSFLAIRDGNAARALGRFLVVVTTAAPAPRNRALRGEHLHRSGLSVAAASGRWPADRRGDQPCGAFISFAARSTHHCARLAEEL